MIYEFLEMAEKDIVSEAYKYKYLITTISNFYPSLFTHSIPWAAHGNNLFAKNHIEIITTFLGIGLINYSNSNDGCTNGIPIGPVVSDLISELILLQLIYLSKKLKEEDEYFLLDSK